MKTRDHFCRKMLPLSMQYFARCLLHLWHHRFCRRCDEHGSTLGDALSGKRGVVWPVSDCVYDKRHCPAAEFMESHFPRDAGSDVRHGPGPASVTDTSRWEPVRSIASSAGWRLLRDDAWRDGARLCFYCQETCVIKELLCANLPVGMFARRSLPATRCGPAKVIGSCASPMACWRS